MTKNIIKTALVVVSAGSLLAGCDFEQPEAGCIVQDAGNWYAKYDQVEAPKLADGSACTAVPPVAERIGVYKFVNPDAGNATTLTIRPAGLASLGARDAAPPSQQTAIGSLATDPDAEQFCGAPTFSVASVNAAAVPATGTQPAIPATTVSYEFSNIRVYSAPATPGTQLTGELKYTKDGCTSTYIVRAMWPAAPCLPGSTEADLSCGQGSGLNPDFAAECIPRTGPAMNCDLTAQMIADGYGCCIPSKAIPSFRDAAK